MADLLPSTSDASAGDAGEPRVIGVDSEDADDLLSALQSETARSLLGALYDEPMTPSELAEAADTSVQNVRYHLEKLEDADLVEDVDTIYSEKGREMTVYAPASKPLVVFAGNDDETPGIEAALSRLLGALGVLGLSSLVVEHVFGGGLFSFGLSSGSGGRPDGGVQTGDDSGYQIETTTEGDRLTGGSDNATGTMTESEEATQAATESTTTAAETTRTPETTQEVATTTQDAATTAEDATTTAAQTTEAADATRTAETTEMAAETTEATRAVADETTRATTTATDLAATTEPEVATTVADGAGAATGTLPPGLVFFAGGLVALLVLGMVWYRSGV